MIVDSSFPRIGGDAAGSRPHKRRCHGLIPSESSNTALQDITNSEADHDHEHGDGNRSTDVEGEQMAAEAEAEDKFIQPHLRHACRIHPFSEGASVSNAKCCSQCYCFICNSPAKLCPQWRDGSSKADHCNAYNNSLYRAIRVDHLNDAVMWARPARYAERIKRDTELLPPTPDMVCLGEIRLRCKAHGTTLRNLDAKIIRYGAVCITRNNCFRPEWDRFSGLHLHTLFRKDCNRDEDYWRSRPLSLLPFEEPPPMEEVPAERRLAVVFTQWSSSGARPKLHGVVIPSYKAKIKDILAEAQEQQIVSSDQSSSVKFFLTGFRPDGALYATHLGTTKETTSSWKLLFSGKRVLHIQVPITPPLCKQRLGALNETAISVVVHHADTSNSSKYWGIPIVLNADRQTAKGGYEAFVTVKQAILDALSPAGTLPELRRLSDLRDFSDFELQCLDRLNGYDQVRLVAVWEDGELSSRLQDWLMPETAPSAAPELLSESVDRQELQDKQDKIYDDALSGARGILNELKRLCLCSAPKEVHHKTYGRKMSYVCQEMMPALRSHVRLEAADPEATEGEAVLRLWAWSTIPPNPSFSHLTHRKLLLNKGDCMQDYYSTSGLVSEMQRVLQALASNIAAVKEAEADKQSWKKRESDIRDSATLLSALETGEIEPAKQPEGLSVTLRPYQLQTLGFMQRAETGEGGFRKHFWYWIPPDPATEAFGFWWSPIYEQASLTEPPKQPWGGFLCETMGLGKTVEVLALILSDRPRFEAAQEQGVPHIGDSLPPTAPAASFLSARQAPLLPHTKIASNATLVVCVVSLVGQWVAEAKAKTGGSLRIYEYHGQGRCRDEVKLANNYDVIVTTYATLSSDWSIKRKKKGEQQGGEGAATLSSDPDDILRLKKSPLHRVEWYRLVLDESHCVKDVNTMQTRACAALAAKRRWCCTGTPVSKEDAKDLAGQFVALQMAPFNDPGRFNTYYRQLRYSLPYRKEVLLFALGRAMVRHTKAQVTGGETVLQLPPLEQHNVEVKLSKAESVHYKATYSAAFQAFERIVAGPCGASAASKNLLKIMSLLLPLRRITSGGILSGRDLQVPEVNPNPAAPGQPSVVPGLVVPSDAQCPICLDALERPVRTPCEHWFCLECISGCLERKAACPLCRAAVKSSALQMPMEELKAPVEEQDVGSAGPETVHCESKLKALVKELRAMQESDPSAKALVFSQFMSTIDWLKARLPEEGFGFRYIDGSMPMKKRSQAIADFQGDPPTTVFLLSMRAGAVGINLTAASHVFMLEPAFNPALEEQAIGRAWRMGQERTVVVKRLFVKGTVEENIMKLNKRHKDPASAASSSSSSSSSPNPPSNSRPPAEQGSSRGDGTVGNLHTDRQVLKLEELKLLFSVPNLDGMSG